jgi:hypothetical protein
MFMGFAISSAGTLLLEPHLQDILEVILEMESRKLFMQADFDAIILISASQSR